MSIKIAAVDFWPDAFSNDFLSYIVGLATDGNYELTGNLAEADVCFSSVFGKTQTPQDKTIKLIWENVRPDHGKCRFSLSQDLDGWDGRNFYLPIWYGRIAWPGFRYIRKSPQSTHGNEMPMELDSLVSGRSNGQTKSKFCAFFAGNPEVNRINMMRKIGTYKPVDGYGLMFKKPFYRPKEELLAEYKFCLCAENGFHPGYVTEKLFDAYVGGTIPIYFGGIPQDSLFNRRAFINFDGANSDAFLQQIVALDSSEELYRRMHSEPLLLGKPKLEPAVEFLRRCLSEITGRKIG